MTRRTATWLSGLTIAAVGTMAACNKPATASSDLSRDLDAAASSTGPLALAPVAGSQDVVSAVEQSPQARRAPAPSTRVRTVAHTARATPAAVALQPAPQPAPTAATAPQTTEPAVDQVTPSTRPAPVQPAHQGRYKTEAEVFRDAPFPILP